MKMHALSGMKQRNVATTPHGGRQRAGNAERMATSMGPPEFPAGHRITYWIGVQVGQVLDDHGFRPEDLASYTGLVKETIVSFIEGKTWPHQADGLVSAAAALCGIPEPRDIYADALRRMYNEGDAAPPFKKLRQPGAKRPRPAPDHVPQPQDPPPGEEDEEPGETGTG